MRGAIVSNVTSMYTTAVSHRGTPRWYVCVDSLVDPFALPVAAPGHTGVMMDLSLLVHTRTEGPMDGQRLTFLAVSASHLPTSVSFYRDLLGLPLEDTSHDAELNDPWYGGEHAAYSWTDGAFIHFAIYPSREPERPVTTAAQIGFHLASFDAVHARTVDAGV